MTDNGLTDIVLREVALEKIRSARIAALIGIAGAIVLNLAERFLMPEKPPELAYPFICLAVSALAIGKSLLVWYRLDRGYFGNDVGEVRDALVYIAHRKKGQ